MSGKENQTFDPSGYMTRSELAAVAMRLAEYLNADSLTINIIHTNDKCIAHNIMIEFKKIYKWT